MRTVGGAAQGTLCQEGKHIRTAGALLVILVVAAGCHRSGRKFVPPPKPPEKRAVKSENGKVETYSTGPNRRLLWSASYKSVELFLKGEQTSLGKMFDVEGQLYEEGKPPTKFSAHEAVGDKKSNVLTLTGTVSVTGAKEHSNLRCDNVVWYPQDSLIVGTGNVTVESDRYILEGVPEVMAKQDFSLVGTPGLFKEKYGH